MPQEQQQATNPQSDPLAFVYENRKSLANMKPDKAEKLIEHLYKKYLLPKYERANQNNLTMEQSTALLDSFKARMLDVPGAEQTPDMGEKQKSSKTAKVGAAVVGAGAGVLGGVRSFSELIARMDKTNLAKDPIHQAISKAEGKAYDEAQALDPKIASRGAAVGHQIPAMLMAEGVGGLLPKAAKTASVLTKTAVGAGRGAAEGAAYETARPGGDPASGAMWGGALGAAFPLIGKVLGLGRGKAAPAKEVAESVVGSSAGPATSNTSGSMKDLPNIVSQKHFGKAFKDLSPAERAAMPDKLRSEIAAQRTAKEEGRKATKEAMKKVSEDNKAAKRGEKAKAAEQTASKQAEQRATTPSTEVPKATAQAAVAQNPQVTKVVGTFTPEGKVPGGPTVNELKWRQEQYTKLKEMSGQNIFKNAPKEFQHRIRELVNAGLTAEEIKAGMERGLSHQELLNESVSARGEHPITKVAEGQRGVQKAGSPAKQAADRERIAKKRELASREQINTSLEQHARELAGRHTPAAMNLMHLPELEDAIKEMSGGKEILDGARKARKTYKMSDEIYMHTLKEWMLEQFASDHEVQANISEELNP